MTYQFNEDQMLTVEQKKWLNKLQKLLRDMPRGIELILSEHSIIVMQEGFYNDGGLNDEGGREVDILRGNQLIEEHSLDEIVALRFYANSGVI